MILGIVAAVGTGSPGVGVDNNMVWMRGPWPSHAFWLRASMSIGDGPSEVVILWFIWDIHS